MENKTNNDFTNGFNDGKKAGFAAGFSCGFGENAFDVFSTTKPKYDYSKVGLHLELISQEYLLGYKKGHTEGFNIAQYYS